MIEPMNTGQMVHLTSLCFVELGVFGCISLTQLRDDLTVPDGFKPEMILYPAFEWVRLFNNVIFLSLLAWSFFVQQWWIPPASVLCMGFVASLIQNGNLSNSLWAIFGPIAAIGLAIVYVAIR